MQKKLQFFLTTLVIALASFITRQNCTSIHFIKGSTYEMEHYSKEKKTGITKMLVKEVSSNGTTQEAVIHTESFSSSNVKEGEADIKMICTGDKMKIDIKSLMASLKLSENPNIDISIEESSLEFPSNPMVGQTLADNQFKMKMKDKKSGSEMGEIITTISNRQVLAKESITTSAGTFDCWKISSEIKTQMKMMGMDRTMPSTKSISFFNNTVGMIKNENYDEAGTLTSYEVLSKYKKGQ